MIDLSANLTARGLTVEIVRESADGSLTLIEGLGSRASVEQYYDDETGEWTATIVAGSEGALEPSVETRAIGVGLPAHVLRAMEEAA